MYKTIINRVLFTALVSIMFAIALTLIVPVCYFIATGSCFLDDSMTIIERLTK